MESEKNHYKQLLEEKLVEIDRTYLPRQRHDEVLREKNKIIEELKEECLHKEVEYSKEFALKSRNLDERKSKEYESIFTSYKTMIKESEVNIEDLKRKNQGFEEQNKKLIENLKNLENNKRLFEGKMSEKQLELDRLLKEKEGLIQNLKQIEKNLEEKILLIKRMEKHLSQYNDEMKAFESQLTFLNKEKDQLLKEKEASFKEKESFLNEIREKEKTMKEFDREREKIEELSRKNNDLEQYFQQNIAIFKKNCEVLREENIELSSKLKKKCDELNILESELLSFQKKNSQIPSLLEEKNIFQSKEVSQQIQIRDLEIELQRKQAENNEVIEILRKKEEVLQLQERKITRIKGNYNRFQNKIARNFAKMKEDNSNLHYKVQQILTDNLKEQMNKLASFPNHISKFLRSTNDKFMREKEKIEEKMAEKYDDIMKNLKLKYEENEKNSSFLCKNLESKIKELQNENSGFEEKFIKNQEQNRLLEQENVFLQEKNQDLIVKAEDLEKNNSRLEEMKLFFLEMKEKWGSNILLLKKNQAKKLASIKKTLILIQNNVKKQQENHLISFKKLIFEVFELVNKAQKEFDEKQAYWSEKTLTQNEDLRFLQEQLKENQAYKEELEEKLRKSEENNDLMILDYDNSLKQIQENVASQDFAMHSMRKETEKLKITILELEKELLFKNKELNNLKHEKIKLLERNEVDMKNQALREKEINYNEMMQFKKCIKKNRINEDRNHGNDLKIDVLENKIRELQALNRNIFENKKIESDRDRSLLKSPPIKNSLNSISIDLKDFRNF